MVIDVVNNHGEQSLIQDWAGCTSLGTKNPEKGINLTFLHTAMGNK